jgi:MarR family transcriptional regulator for hemolysin
MTASGRPPASLGWLLGGALRSYMSVAEKVAAGIPFGVRGYMVLEAVRSQCPGSQLELGRRLSIDKTVMTHVIDRLEEAGFVERQADPSDRRARRIVLTPAGEDVLERTGDQLGAQECQLLSGLSDSQKTSLTEALAVLAAHSGQGAQCGEIVACLASPA